MNPRNLLIAGTLVVLLVLVTRGFGRERDTALPYQTASVQRGDLVSTVSATGTLSAVGTVEVGTQVSGTIAQVLVDFNDLVQEGDLLAVVDPESLDAALRQASAEVDRGRAQIALAQAQYEEAQARLGRNQELFDKGYLSRQEWLSVQTSAATAQASVTSAEAQVASAEAGLSQVRKNRRNAEIRAPISGVVIQRNVDEGQTVAASFSTPTLFVIAEDLAKMEILAQVDESDIGLVAPGQPLEFSVTAYPDRKFEGVVIEERLQPQTIQNVVLYTVVVSAENDSGLLLPGMTATVDFVVGGVEDALLIPASALRFDPPEEVRSAARDFQRVASAAEGGEGVQDAGFSANVAEIWVPKAEGSQGPMMRSLLVRVIASNGTMAAIEPRTAGDTDALAPGGQVVTRMREVAGTRGPGR